MDQTSPPVDAWEVGVRKHLASLPLAEQMAFMAPASVEDCMLKIQQIRHRQRNGYHRLMQTFRPVVEPLKRFEGAIDVLSQTNSGMLSPVWGPLRAVITLASDRLATLHTLSQLLERLVEPLARFQSYENLFQDNAPLRRAIGSLYCDLIDFCARAVRFYGKMSIRTIFGTFDRDFREVSDNIRHHWTEIDIAANFVNISEAKVLRDAEEARRRLQVRGDIQRWLCPATVSDDLRRCHAECMPGSCEWFFDTEGYKSLRSKSGSYALRVVARPGEGKTILASFIISDLIRKAPGRTLYFFCKAGHAEKRLPSHVLRSLVSQLWRFNDELYSIMERWYQNSGRPTADCYSELCTILKSILSNLPPSPLFIVIDALDECNEPRELIDFLRLCQSEILTSLKLVFTSRDHPDLRQTLDFCQRQISMPVQTVKESISKYVTKRISDMSFLAGAGLDAELVLAITTASDGLWLYARLLLDEISLASSPSEVRRMMACLPENLKELYSSILRSVGGRFSDLQVRLAQQIFIWLDGADYMPWWHFHSDNILEDNVLNLLIQFVNDGESAFDPASLIQKLCFPLVNVFRTNDEDEGRLYAASFIHFSAEQYLQWTSELPPRLLPTVMKPRRLKSLHRGVTAAWYYTESLDFRQVLNQLREDPHSNGVGAYFEMAYGMGDCWWMANLPPDLEPDELREVEKLCPVLIKFVSTTACLGWAEAAILINYAGGYMNLLENVEKAIRLLSCHQEPDCSAWGKYLSARRVFFIDWAYVLQITGPGYQKFKQPPTRPQGFGDRAVAIRILDLARRYQYYVDEAFNAVNSTANQTVSGSSSGPGVSSREWLRRRSSGAAH